MILDIALNVDLDASPDDSESGTPEGKIPLVRMCLRANMPHITRSSTRPYPSLSAHQYCMVFQGIVQ